MTKILLTYRQHGDDVAASWAITSNLCLILTRFAVSVSPLHGMGQSDQQLCCAVQFRSIHKFQEEQNMNQDEQKPCCVNCHISGVPLYLGLDGKQHCADHIGLLLPDFPKQETKPVRKDVIL